jgi:putative sterol carrier protein
MGFYSRAAVVSGPGVVLGDGEQMPTLGDVHRNWATIENLEGAQEYHDANAALMDMLSGSESTVSDQESAVNGQRSAERESKGGILTVQGVFDKMTEFFRPEAAAGMNVIFQFSIAGPGGGDWHVVVKDGEAEDFLKLIGGQLPAMQAYTTGKLRIEGDLMKSQLVEKLFKFG